VAVNCTHEAECTPFQTHYFSENLVAPGIEPGPLDLQPGILTTEAINCTHEAEWTPFQTHYFSENMVVPGIERGPLDL
jgi:hypothetical protein